MQLYYKDEKGEAIEAKIKKVFIIWRNTDTTEGRGRLYPYKICESFETALRLGKGKDVQGGNCRVEEGIAFKIDGIRHWHVPGIIENELQEDKVNREKREKREAAIEKAKAAGLTDDEILLMKG